MEEKMKNNFFKKLWYSITKPSKYDELRKLGVGKAIKYIFSIISILALILAIITTFLKINEVFDAISYLEGKLPDFTFKDNKLELDNADASILDDDRIINYLGNKIVINPLIEKNEAIDLYRDLATEKNKVLVFLNEEYILISNNYNPENNNEEGIENKKYIDVTKNIIKDTNYEYSKKDAIEYLRKRATYTYYVAQYFVIYFIKLLLLYGIYIILISISIWLVTKILKFKWTYKESIMNTIYASTLSMIVYVIYIIISYFTNLMISIMDIINIFLIFAYIYLLMWKQRNKKNENKEEAKN